MSSTRFYQLEAIRQLIDLRRYELALGKVMELLAADPEDAQAHHLLGRVLCAKEDWHAAREAIEKSIELDPSDAYSFNLLGGIALQKRNFQEAASFFLMAIKLEPNEATFHANLAKVYLSRKNHKKAREQSELGLSIDPENEACLNSLVLAYQGLGRYAKAKSLLEDNLRQNPENLETLTYLGSELYRKEDYAQSEEVYRSMLRSNAEFEPAIEGFKEASTANNFLIRLFTNRKLKKKFDGAMTIALILVINIIRFLNLPDRIYWIFLVILVQVFTLWPALMGFGKLLAYQRQKEIRMQFSSLEISNAIVQVILFLLNLTLIVSVGNMLVSDDPFNLTLFLASVYVGLFQMTIGIRIDMFTKSLSWRRAFLLTAIALAIVTLIVNDFWWIPFSLSIVVMAMDVLFHMGLILQRWQED